MNGFICHITVLGGNSMKKLSKGFTLVELIVVIAIIGILAAILVPALLGYIKDSKLTSANSSAKTIYTAASNYAQKCVVEGCKINPMVLQGTIAPTDSMPAWRNDGVVTNQMILQAINCSMGADAKGSYCAVMIGANGFPKGAVWAKSQNDPYVGAYPNEADDTFTGDSKFMDALDHAVKVGSSSGS